MFIVYPITNQSELARISAILEIFIVSYHDEFV